MKLTNIKLSDVFIFLAATVLPLFLWNKLQGVDNLYMYSHAEDMLANGLSRTTDIFSMHDGFAFSYQKWAACILTYGIVKWFGWNGLTIATYVFIFLVLLCLYLFGLKFNPEHKMGNAIAIMVCAYLMEANGTLRFRPHVFAGLLFIYMFCTIERYIKFELTRGIDFYLRFIVTSVILMWFHSTMWIMYVVVFLPYVMNFNFYGRSKLFLKKFYHTKPLLLSMILMFIAGALNPNGFTQYKYMWSCMMATGSKYSHVDELQRMPFSAYMVLLTVGCLLLVWMIYMLITYHVRIYVPSMYLILGSLAMPLVSWRLVFYSALFLAIASMLYMRNISLKDFGCKPFVLPLGIVIMSIVIFLAGGMSRLFMSSASKTALACGTKSQEIVDAVDFVAELNPNATVFTTTAHVGSYSIYRHLKPYMDCRAEVYDDAINQQSDILSEIHGLSNNLYRDTKLDAGGIELLQQEYHPDYYVLTKYSDADQNIKTALDGCGASLIFGTSDSEVWVYQY